MNGKERLDYWNWYVANAGPGWPDPSKPLAEISGADVFFWPATNEMPEHEIRAYLDERAKELDLDEFVTGLTKPTGAVIVTQFECDMADGKGELHVFELDALASEQSRIVGSAARSFGDLGGKLVQ